MFIQGRHKYITSLFLFQDTTMVPPGLRKNAFIKIFCAHESVISYFNTSNNGISKITKKISEQVSDKIFEKTPGIQNFKKLVFIRGAEQKIQYAIADGHPKFQLGSETVRRFGDKIETGETIDIDNNFYGNFFV